MYRVACPACRNPIGIESKTTQLASNSSFRLFCSSLKFSI